MTARQISVRIGRGSFVRFISNIEAGEDSMKYAAQPGNRLTAEEKTIAPLNATPEGGQRLVVGTDGGS